MTHDSSTIITLSVPLEIRVRQADAADTPAPTDRAQFDVRIPDLNLAPGLSPAIVDVVVERFGQIQQGYDADHDDSHDDIAWCRLLDENIRRYRAEPTLTGRRHRFVVLAALAVAAIEAWDRQYGTRPAPEGVRE